METLTRPVHPLGQQAKSPGNGKWKRSHEPCVRRLAHPARLLRNGNGDAQAIRPSVRLSSQRNLKLHFGTLMRSAHPPARRDRLSKTVIGDAHTIRPSIHPPGRPMRPIEKGTWERSRPSIRPSTRPASRLENDNWGGCSRDPSTRPPARAARLRGYGNWKRARDPNVRPPASPGKLVENCNWRRSHAPSARPPARLAR